MSNKLTDKLLTPPEVASLLGLTQNTLALWRCTKRYPELVWIKVGRLIRYRESDVEAFLSRRSSDSKGGEVA